MFVSSLISNLQSKGVEGCVFAPAAGPSNYVIGRAQVFRYAVSGDLAQASAYGEGDLRAADEFERLVSTVRPEIAHFHALTAGASLGCMRRAVKCGLPVLMTYHTPTVSCVRGTMMRWGTTPCDGAMDARRCSACVMQGKGLPKFGALALSMLPAQWLARLSRLAHGRMRTVLALPYLVRLRHETTREAWRLCERVVAVCDWVRQVLRNNDVPEAKIVLSRQGLARPGAVGSGRSALPLEFCDVRPLRLVFFGRLSPEKGLNVLTRALSLCRELPISLDVYGLPTSDARANFSHRAKSQPDDPRVRFLEPVDSERVAETMRAYDLVVVPSIWQETGPLVVYEAFGAGVPVLGSRLGGIAELVSDGVHGMLIEAGSPERWRDALWRVVREPSLIERWGAALPKPRGMDEVANEMAALYVELTQVAKRRNSNA